MAIDLPLASYTRTRHRGRKHVRRGLILLVLMMFFWVAVLPFLPVSTQFHVLTAVGRTDVRCSSSQVATDSQIDARRLAAIDAQLAALPQPRADEGLLRFDTPAGTVWAPSTSPREFIAAVRPSRVRWDIEALNPVRAGDIVLDAGGHLGESTLRALELGAARVVTFEPNPDNARALRKNLARPIADGRVIVIEQGVYDRVGMLTFHQGVDSASGEFEEGSVDALPITTIDRVVADLGLARVDFIKMDIEGSEVPALRGAVETLRRFKPRVAVGTYHKGRDLADVEQTVLATRTDYQVRPARCLPYRSRVFPLLLFFE
jgi:FkbM family methyltransferase